MADYHYVSTGSCKHDRAGLGPRSADWNTCPPVPRRPRGQTWRRRRTQRRRPGPLSDQGTPAAAAAFEATITGWFRAGAGIAGRGGAGRNRRWDLEQKGEVTSARYTWDVRTTKPWMNLAAPIARPLFTWNSKGVMWRPARVWPLPSGPLVEPSSPPPPRGCVRCGGRPGSVDSVAASPQGAVDRTA